jgi:hypothetical protein
MKAAYNQNDLGLYPLNEIYEDPCDNCIFIRSENYTCILADFGEDNFDELPRCWNAIFISEPLSDIFEL